jgi:hypothetical protein
MNADNLEEFDTEGYGALFNRAGIILNRSAHEGPQALTRCEIEVAAAPFQANLKIRMRIAPRPYRLAGYPHIGPGFLIAITQDERVDAILLFDTQGLPVTRIDGL